MALSGKQFTIVAGDHEATVVEVGAGLRRYTHRGTEVTVSYGEDVLPPMGCGAVLVPWPNRLRDGKYSFDGADYQLALSEPHVHNAIHGLGRWSRWLPLRVEPSAVTLGLDIVPQAGWPFEVRVELTYTLHPEHGLAVTAVARNTGRRRAPFGAGFHPYLATYGQAIADVRLKVPARERLVMDEVQVPVGVQSVAGTPYDLRRGRRLGELRLDDAYTGVTFSGGHCSVELRTHRGGSRVWFDRSFHYVQVYTLDHLVEGRPGIAVEPMTCAADAFNSGAGLVVLEPGAAWTGTWGVQPL